MDVETLLEVDKAIEEFYPNSIETGRILSEIFNESNKTQIKNFENIICSTTRFTEAYNFIKNQIGKSAKDKGWTKRIPDNGRETMIGERILKEMYTLEKKSEKITDDKELVFDVRMRLLRGWIKQVVAHYEYNLIKEGG